MTTENTAMAARPAQTLDQPEEPRLASMAPPVDIYENQDEILVVADFPGVPKDALSVKLDRSELVIEGTQAVPTWHETNPALTFSRTFRLPSTIDPDEVRAELTHGVLRVHLAKSEAAKPKRIEVNGS